MLDRARHGGVERLLDHDVAVDVGEVEDDGATGRCSGGQPTLMSVMLRLTVSPVLLQVGRSVASP
ncbi:hypothetical protein SBD_2225 [Streptomyces bottropensis ATCC 25435]|uniref:Uncharacterized protein n=1 Tax=Streptomyces bottropensis ATCC 25435 TaxID=1054862 RepID=M3FTN0_9ACTN|nr:hypothetical protein SBD_2225 [Streptomyces bottropensis ATCC 25435]